MIDLQQRGRGLARLLHDDPAMLAFFGGRILSDDEQVPPAGGNVA
jgi:hypothetical protein